MKNALGAVILAIGLGSAGFLIGNGFVDAQQPQRTVLVKGLAEKRVKADQGQWIVRYKVVNNELSGLYQSIESTENKIKQFFLSQGFQQNEISIQPQTINDNQGNSYGNNSNVPRFSADGSVMISTTAVDNILTSAQKVGVLVKNEVVVTGTTTTFRYTKLNSIKPQMLVEATQNARKAAVTFAKQSESVLGQIKNARQGIFTIKDADSDYGSDNDIYKKVRVVSTITFFLE